MESERETGNEICNRECDEASDKNNDKKESFIQEILSLSLTIKDLFESKNIATDYNLSSLILCEEKIRESGSTENVEALTDVKHHSRNSEIGSEDIQAISSPRNNHLEYQGSILEGSRLQSEDKHNVNKEEKESEQGHEFPPQLDESLSNSLCVVNNSLTRNEEEKCHIVPQENGSVIAKNDTRAPPLVYEVQEMKISSVPPLSDTISKLQGFQYTGKVLSLPPKNECIQPAFRQNLDTVVLENCKNTVLGTGISADTLTINQYVDLSNFSSGLSPESQIIVSDSSWTENCCIKLRYLWAALLLAIIITIAVTASCLIFLRPESTLGENVSEITSNEALDVPANYTLRLVSRSQWTNNPNAKLKPLTVQPARFVVVCHTAGVFCNTTATCTNIVKNIESWLIQLGLSTAWYNFMIGGDGFIYEGRGWDKEGEHSPRFNCASIGVAFLGNYDIKQLTPIMIESYNILMEEGVRRGALIKDYKMVGHYAVKNSSSPGRNIKAVLKTWAHWSPLKKEDFCSN